MDETRHSIKKNILTYSQSGEIKYERNNKWIDKKNKQIEKVNTNVVR